MTRDSVIQIICVAVAVGGITASAVLTPALNRQRRDLQLSYDIDMGDRLPPEYALLPALGSLRGIIVDILWYRAETMKREGKFHESKNLSEFITKLQPRFPDVWVFHAWNLAFNISVETYTPEERWDWVKSGITLLRDQALVYNPTSVKLYKELGWQLFFKLGKEMDDAHWYYKAMWAQEWHELLGEPSREVVAGRTEDSGIPVYQATEDFAKISEATGVYYTGPRHTDPLTQLLTDHPDARPLVDALRAVGIEFNAAGLRRVGRLTALEPYFGGDLSTLRQRIAPDDPAVDHAVLAILADPALRKQLDTVLPFWRAKALIEDYHMKPRKMLEVMRRYGPLDWRHPASHGAYFNYMGVEMAGELRDNSNIDVLNTVRGEIHAMQSLLDKGNVVYNPITGSIDMLPDPRFIPAYDIAWDKAIKNVVSQSGFSGESTMDNFAAGHENFLIKAALFAYFYGSESDARRYVEKARDLYAGQMHNEFSARYDKPLEDFIMSEYASDWSMPEVMLAFVEGQIQQGIVQGLRIGRIDLFNRRVTLARQAFDKFKGKYDYSNILTGASRISLAQSWDQLLANSYVNTITSPALPLLERARVWSNTPPDLMSAAYLKMRPIVRKQCEDEGLSFDRAFPPPPGFKEPKLPEQPRKDNAPDIERQ